MKPHHTEQPSCRSSGGWCPALRPSLNLHKEKQLPAWGAQLCPPISSSCPLKVPQGQDRCLRGLDPGFLNSGFQTRIWDYTSMVIVETACSCMKPLYFQHFKASMRLFLLNAIPSSLSKPKSHSQSSPRGCTRVLRNLPESKPR